MTQNATALSTPWTIAIPPQHFMIHDIAGSLLAVLAFAAVLYAPGYLVAHAADVFQFRQKSFADRSLWAIACSFCVAPIVAYMVGRSAGLNAVGWFFTACALATLLLLMSQRRNLGWSQRDARITILVASACTAFVLLMLVDFQTGKKLFFSVALADESYRIAFIDAVVHTGVPPANPLYFSGSPAPMRYYYFWYLLCAAVVKVAHVSARQSYIASCIWAAFGLLATIKLYASDFFRWGRKQTWIALGLLLVTGADLIPALGNAILQPLNGDIEWWSVDPIDAWPDSLLWVPHHVASVLCCLLAFLFLWRILEPINRNAKRASIAFAAVAFASAVGLSVYVAFGFALLTLAWLIRLAVLKHPQFKGLALHTACAALLSAALLSPYFVELTRRHLVCSPTAGTSPTTHLFMPSVRRMIDPELITSLAPLSAWKLAHPLLLDQTMRLLLLLPGLAMELGLYGAVLVLLLLTKRRREPSPNGDARDTALFLTLCGLIMTMFLGSSVISNNDFGYRAVMLPQFFLLLLTADVLASWWIPSTVPTFALTSARKTLLYTLLVLGFAGSLYAAFLLRAWLPMEVTRPQNGFAALPDDAYQVREAFAAFNQIAPGNAVLSFNPLDQNRSGTSQVMSPDEFYQRLLVMNAEHQMLNAESKCATHFGGDPAQCSSIQGATTQLYANPAPSTQWTNEYCRRFGVQFLVVGYRDPAWESPTGWPSSLPVVVQEAGLRILKCIQ